MDATDAGTSCAVLPDRKNSADVSKNGKFEYYPIERALLGLARRPNFYVLAAFESCRESTIDRPYVRYDPSFIAELEQVANEGSWTVLHSCEEGDTTIDTPGEDPYTKKKLNNPDEFRVFGKKTKKRHSWGIPAYMRKICNDKVKR